MGFGDREVRLGQVTRVDDGHTWGHVQAARAADYGQTRIWRLAERVDLALGDTHNLIGMILVRRVGTDDRVRPVDRGCDLLGVVQVVMLEEYTLTMLGHLRRISGDGGQAM